MLEHQLLDFLCTSLYVKANTSLSGELSRPGGGRVVDFPDQGLGQRDAVSGRYYGCRRIFQHFPEPKTISSNERDARDHCLHWQEGACLPEGRHDNHIEPFKCRCHVFNKRQEENRVRKPLSVHVRLLLPDEPVIDIKAQYDGPLGQRRISIKQRKSVDKKFETLLGIYLPRKPTRKVS